MTAPEDQRRDRLRPHPEREAEGGREQRSTDPVHPAPLAQLVSEEDEERIPAPPVPPEEEDAFTVPSGRASTLDAARALLQVLLVAMIAVTAVSMVVLSWYAFVPATILLVLFALTLVLKAIGDRAERPRSPAGHPREPLGGQAHAPTDAPYGAEVVYSAEREDAGVVPTRPERAGRRVLTAVALGAIAFGAVAGAGIFGWELLGVSWIFMTGIALLFGISVWLALMTIVQARAEARASRRRRQRRHSRHAFTVPRRREEEPVEGGPPRQR